MVRFPRASMLLMLAAAPIQIADDVALIFFRGDVFHFHDRLEQDRFALLEAIFHRKNRRHLESQFVGIDFVDSCRKRYRLRHR